LGAVLDAELAGKLTSEILSRRTSENLLKANFGEHPFYEVR
jgi:hypothetical protein